MALGQKTKQKKNKVTIRTFQNKKQLQKTKKKKKRKIPEEIRRRIGWRTNN